MVANDNWTLISNKTTENTDKSYVFVSVYSTIFFVKMRGLFCVPHPTIPLIDSEEEEADPFK